MQKIRNFFTIDDWPRYIVWILLVLGASTLMRAAILFIWSVATLQVLAILSWVGTFAFVAILSVYMYHHEAAIVAWFEEKFK